MTDVIKALQNKSDSLVDDLHVSQSEEEAGPERDEEDEDGDRQALMYVMNLC